MRIRTLGDGVGDVMILKCRGVLIGYVRSSVSSIHTPSRLTVIATQVHDVRRSEFRAAESEQIR